MERGKNCQEAELSFLRTYLARMTPIITRYKPERKNLGGRGMEEERDSSLANLVLITIFSTSHSIMATQKEGEKRRKKREKKEERTKWPPTKSSPTTQQRRQKQEKKRERGDQHTTRISHSENIRDHGGGKRGGEEKNGLAEGFL